MMHMSFWFGHEVQDLLFGGFNINTVPGFAVFCFGLVCLTMLYESLNVVHEQIQHSLERKLEQRSERSDSTVRLNTPSPIDSQPQPQTDAASVSTIGSVQTTASSSSAPRKLTQHDRSPLLHRSSDAERGWQSSIMNLLCCCMFFMHDLFADRNRLVCHLIQTLLHLVQTVYGYLIMLTVMSYNFYFFLSVVIGAGAGYFLFGVVILYRPLRNKISGVTVHRRGPADGQETVAGTLSDQQPRHDGNGDTATSCCAVDSCPSSAGKKQSKQGDTVVDDESVAVVSKSGGGDATGDDSVGRGSPTASYSAGDETLLLNNSNGDEIKDGLPREDRDKDGSLDDHKTEGAKSVAQPVSEREIVLEAGHGDGFNQSSGADALNAGTEDGAEKSKL